MYQDAMRSIGKLGEDILAQVASDNLALSTCFEDERKRIGALINQLEEMTIAIQEADPNAYEDAATRRTSRATR